MYKAKLQYNNSGYNTNQYNKVSVYYIIIFIFILL